MRCHISTLLAVLPLLVRRSTAQDWPEPETTNGGVLSGIRDPSLIRRSSDGLYFLFGTNGNGTMHTATSMYGPWTSHPGGALNVNQTVVAPQVYEVGGTYYMYYSQHTGPTSDAYFRANIHVQASKTMNQKDWVEHGQLKIPTNNAKLANHASNDGYNILDASLLVVNGSTRGDEDKYYLSFGSYYSGLFQTTLDSPMDLNANMTVQQMNHLEVNNTGGHSTEGSFQYAWPTDGSSPTKYYLFFSSGQCCKFKQMGVPAPGDEYKIMVCRADTPTGPFKDAAGKDCLTQNGGTMVLGSHDSVYAPGGQGVMYSDEVNSTVLYYHYTPTNTTSKRLAPNLNVGDNGAIFGWNKLDFDDQGWPVVAGTRSGMTVANARPAEASGIATEAKTSAGRRRMIYPWRGWF